MYKFLMVGAACVLPFSAMALDLGTKEEAVKMVELAEKMINIRGMDSAVEMFNDKTSATFHDRDLYIYVYDFGENGDQAVVVAHGSKPELIGKNLIEATDANGKSFIQDLVNTARSESGEGWVDYVYPHPVTKKNAEKAGYVKRVKEHYFVGSGIYK